MSLYSRLICWLDAKCFPMYDCENCIGMAEHGCYCDANDCFAPCTPPNKRIRALRWILKRIRP